MDSCLIDWSDNDDMQNQKNYSIISNSMLVWVQFTSIVYFCFALLSPATQMTWHIRASVNSTFNMRNSNACWFASQPHDLRHLNVGSSRSHTSQTDSRVCAHQQRPLHCFSACFFIFPAMLAYVAVGTAVHIQLWLYAHIRASPLSAAYTDSTAQRRWCDCVCVWLIHYVKVFQWSERNNTLHIFV